MSEEAETSSAPRLAYSRNGFPHKAVRFTRKKELLPHLLRERASPWPSKLSFYFINVGDFGFFSLQSQPLGVKYSACLRGLRIHSLKTVLEEKGLQTSCKTNFKSLIRRI